MVIDSTIRFNDRMDGPSVSLGSKLSNAKVSFAIFKRDIKRLLVNPVALVVTLGVCVIPSLYAWYNIVANWDPYGNTQGIKIAIANNDRGTQNDLVGELNAGDQVVDQLGRTAHDLLHGLRVALASAADERVANMLLERVGRVGHRADAALCVVRIALVDLAFGHERHMTVSSRLERETESCGPRPDNQEIGFHN